MEHTQNYHLPQWVKSDRIMMDDFNAAMSSIESGLTAAQSTASAAQSAASAAGAKANAAYTPSNKPYVAGTYYGDFTLKIESCSPALIARLGCYVLTSVGVDIQLIAIYGGSDIRGFTVQFRRINLLPFCWIML